MATVLDKVLKRRVTVDGADYTVVLDQDGLQLVAKGKRRPEITLRWQDLLNGEAALTAALNASLSTNRRSAAQPAGGELAPSPVRTSKRTLSK